MVNSFDILILNISDIQKFQDFQGLFLKKSVFPGLSRPGNCKIKFKDFQGPVRTLLLHLLHKALVNLPAHRLISLSHAQSFILYYFHYFFLFFFFFFPAGKNEKRDNPVFQCFWETENGTIPGKTGQLASMRLCIS